MFLTQSRSSAGPIGYTTQLWLLPLLWAGSKRWSQVCPHVQWGPVKAAREGCVRLCCVARKPASESRSHPHPEERVANRVVAPSAGEARKCHPAGSGSQKWAQMVLFTALSSHGLGIRPAGLESAAVTEAGRGPHGVSFSCRPREGCGPRPRRALSMVRGAAECGPALLAWLLPRVVLSPMPTPRPPGSSSSLPLS